MSIDTIIKLSGTVPAGATSNDIAALDIPEDGEILCIAGVISGIYEPAPGASANINLRLAAEISFLSTNQIGANDARGAIGGIAVSAVILWSEPAETGGAGANLSEFGDICPPDGISVNAGERIHLHGFSNQSGLTADVSFLLYIKAKGGARRAARRR